VSLNLSAGEVIRVRPDMDVIMFSLYLLSGESALLETHFCLKV
jgi:hypothetical protein